MIACASGTCASCGREPTGSWSFGAYGLDPGSGRLAPYALQVLALRGTQIEEITGFVSPEHFTRFGLPAELAA